MSRLPTTVTIVAAVRADGPLGATANAVTSLSLAPPLVLACLDHGSRTLGAIQADRRFSVNVLAADQADLARRFSTKDPHDEKWAQVPWHEEQGLPRIEGTVLWIGCRLHETHDGGDHVVLVGEVAALDDGERRPLVFHEGGYRGLED
jgi:flavin reductase (DIM6/NTAB) family NADH-FMN oxidoreductase RutF